MKIDDNHYLSEAAHCHSPNYDNRPCNTDISLIVIHCISLPPNEFNNTYIDDLFCNRLDANAHAYFSTIAHLKVSAHLLIKRTGTITQYVAFNKRAWHAGQSHYLGRERCNDFSIGIELEGADTSPYTEIQYKQLASVIKTLLGYYPTLSPEHIVGHSDIAPLRKTDPGKYFDWQKLQQLLALLSAN